MSNESPQVGQVEISTSGNRVLQLGHSEATKDMFNVLSCGSVYRRLTHLSWLPLANFLNLVSFQAGPSAFGGWARLPKLPAYFISPFHFRESAGIVAYIGDAQPSDFHHFCLVD